MIGPSEPDRNPGSVVKRPQLTTSALKKDHFSGHVPGMLTIG
jgi:hypothetical protein